MDYLNRLMGQGELVVFLTRRHGSVLLPALLLALALCALVAAGTLGAAYALGYGDLAYVGFALLALPLAWLAWRIIVWQNEAYVVTNRRVVQMRGVVNKEVLDSSLEKVNDIELRQSLLGRLFNFGDLEILTASAIGVNRLSRIARPLAFKNALLTAKQELEHPTQPPGQATDLTSLLISLKTLRDQHVLSEDEYQAKKAELLARF